MANLDHHVAITPATVSDAASISKQVIAFSVPLLAGRRQLSFDDDVGKFIPNCGARGHRITSRHLLTNTSGLRGRVRPPGTRTGYAGGHQ